MLKDIVWLLCSKVESKFGYNRVTEVICSIITFAICGPKLWRLNNDSAKLIVITAWMPAYLENISEVLLQLKERGLNVAIFPEWQRSKEDCYDIEVNKYSNNAIYYDAHRALPFIKSKIFLSSTAAKHYYFSKSNKRFFYFHSVAGLNGFPEGGMDDYTDFLCATSQQLEELRARFEVFGYKKSLYEAGYPKFDHICNRIKEVGDSTGSRPGLITTVLVAPSYASENIYQEVSMLPNINSLISILLDSGCRVIFRPHPVSLRRGNFIKKIQSVRNFYSNKPDFIYDETQDYFETYRSADVMVTDVSGTSMMFKAAFKKPVIFYTPNPKLAVVAYASINQIGPVTDQVQEVSELVKKVDNADSHYIPRVFKTGCSTEAFVDILTGQSWMR